MRVLAWTSGVLTTLGLLFVWFAWQLERNINAHPERVVGDYRTAAVAVPLIGDLLTLAFALAAKYPGQQGCTDA